MAATNAAALPSLIVVRIQRRRLTGGRAVLPGLATARFFLARLAGERFVRVPFAFGRLAVARERLAVARLAGERLVAARFALTRLAAAFLAGFLRRILGMRDPEGSLKGRLKFIKIQLIRNKYSNSLKILSGCPVAQERILCRFRLFPRAETQKFPQSIRKES
jgi:hypothetical protein